METRINESIEMSVLLLDEQREHDANSSIHQTSPRAGLSIRRVRKIIDKYVKKAGITKQNLLQHHDAIGVDDAAFAFLALNGNLLALVQIFDHQGDDLLALMIEHERVLINADGSGFDIPIILCLVGARDNVRLGTLGMNGNADHGDLASMLL